MKRFSAAAAVCLLAACGGSDKVEPCSVTSNSDGSATITCPDGSSAKVPTGKDGADGANGQNGAPGTSGAPGTNGTSGANGTDGTDGQNGINGTNGTDNHIVASIFCQGALPPSSMFASYAAALTAAGDVFVRASVRDALIEVDAASFYAATQGGAATASVVFEYDSAAPANGGWWNIGLNRATLVQSVVYNDADVAGGQLVWTKDPSECTVNTY